MVSIRLREMSTKSQVIHLQDTLQTIEFRNTLVLVAGGMGCFYHVFIYWAPGPCQEPQKVEGDSKGNKDTEFNPKRAWSHVPEP